MARAVNVGARELKTRLGTYLERVRRGQLLTVTDRGQPVAELRPVTRKLRSRADRVAQLSALGVVTPPVRRLAPFTPIAAAGPPVAETLLQDREDRF